MDNEKAAKIILCMGWGYPESEIEEAAKMAAGALRGESEAQTYRTAKRPAKMRPYMTYPETIMCGSCPNCGEFVSQESSYCTSCGQALDWTEEGR